MAGTWDTVAPGIRARKHPTRKHGARLDRYFTLRFSANGKQVEEALGWASEGWNVERAQKQLVELRDARRTGKGPKTLREKADMERADAQRAADAKAERERREKTVADLWERYAKDVVAVHNRAATARQKQRLWATRIAPAIGAIKINDVGEEDCGAIVRAALRLNDAGSVVGGKAMAANVYRLMHHMFVKALAWKLRERGLGNPLENIAEPKVSRRERLLASGEITALLQALDAASLTESPQIIAVIKAAIYTGARISELLTLRHEYVRRDEMELHLPDTKTGFSRRPMSAGALAAIDSVEPMPGVPFVFRAVRDARRPLSYQTTEKAFGRITQRAGIEGCTLHTLRHWVATMTANSVSNPRVGMAITGHKSYQSYMGYVHGDRDQAHALADQLSRLTDGLAKAEPSVRVMSKRRSA